MRKNQVTIHMERFGDQVPKNYPLDMQTIDIYVDSNNIYEALSKAYAEAINQLAKYEKIPAFGVCEVSENQ